MNSVSSPAPAGFPVGHIALILLVQLVWGANFIVSKVAIADVPPLIFITARFFCIWILMLPFMRWHAGQMGNVLAISIFAGAGHFALMILALANADDVAPVAIGVQLVPPFSTLLSVMFLGERLGPWRLSALAISFGGILLIGFDPVIFHYWQALAMAAGAALSMAIAQIFMRQVKGVPAYDMQGWVGLGTWPVLLLLSLWLETAPLTKLFEADLVGWASVAYTVLAVSLVGHVGLYWILQRHEITRIAPFLLLAPVIGAILGIVLLDDVVTWRLVVGGIMIFGGVLIITLREGRRRQAHAPVTTRV